MLPENPKNHLTTPHPHGMWLAYGFGRSRKISATSPPPPTESARLTAIPENFCYYPPPPLNGRLTAIPENFCYYPPPPPNLVGLRRSRKIGPPQKKILATPLTNDNKADGPDWRHVDVCQVIRGLLSNRLPQGRSVLATLLFNIYTND